MFPGYPAFESLFKWGITIGIGTLSLGCGGLYLFQNKLIYPSSMPPGSREVVDTPAQHGMPEYEELWLDSPDGQRLHSYLILHNSDVAANLPTVMIFPANAGNIGHRLPIARVFYGALRCNVLMVGYRGYGKSTGSPDEAGLKLDAQCALKYIGKHNLLSNTRLIAYGQSIGGAVAISLVHKNEQSFAGIILENTFLSIPKLVPSVLPIARPIVSLCHQIWDSESLMSTFSVPSLFLSGSKDELVPPEHMRSLYTKCAASTKVFREFANGTHNDTIVQPRYFEEIKAFMGLILGQ